MPDQAPTRGSHNDNGGALEALVAWTVRIAHPVFRWLSIILGAAVALSAIYLGGLAMRNDEVLVAMFEALAIMAGVFATLVALGKFREGAGLALAACALAIGGGAVLTEPTVVSALFKTRGDPVVLGTVAIKPFMLGRIIAGLIIGLGALVLVWSRNPRKSAWYIVRAAFTGIPILAIGVAAWRPEVRTWIDTLPALVRIGGVVAGFFVVLTLVSASGHCVIRSLEVGRLRADGSVDPDGGETPALAA